MVAALLRARRQRGWKCLPHPPSSLYLTCLFWYFFPVLTHSNYTHPAPSLRISQQAQSAQKNWEAQARTNSILAGSLKALEERVDDCATLLDWCVQQTRHSRKHNLSHTLFFPPFVPLIKMSAATNLCRSVRSPPILDTPPSHSLPLFLNFRRHEVDLKFEEIAEQLQGILTRQAEADKDAKRAHKELQSQLRVAAGGAPKEGTSEEGEEGEYGEVAVETPLWWGCTS